MWSIPTSERYTPLMVQHGLRVMETDSVWFVSTCNVTRTQGVVPGFVACQRTHALVFDMKCEKTFL